jgi:hypothetical protein
MANSDSLVVVGQAIETLLIQQKNQGVWPNLKDIWYGREEELIPNTPAINITEEGKNRELYGTGHRTENRFSFYITVFHSKLGDPAITRKECTAFAEEVEAVLHADKTLGGLLFTSMVTALQPGVASRNNVLLKATRLTWVGRSSTRI